MEEENNSKETGIILLGNVLKSSEECFVRWVIFTCQDELPRWLNESYLERWLGSQGTGGHPTFLQ